MAPLRSGSRARKAFRATPVDLMVVGLGNPGADYVHTRHNVGFDTVDALADRWGVGLSRARRERALAGEASVGDRRVVLVQPQTFMNASGESVAPLARRYGITDWSHLVVIHDELDLPLGRLRVKEGGGLAGHNGLRSIRDHLHTADFVRVRIGVGKPPNKEQGANHVLRKVRKSERALLGELAGVAADAVEVILSKGVGEAMNRFNATDLGEGRGDG